MEMPKKSIQVKSQTQNPKQKDKSLNGNTKPQTRNTQQNRLLTYNVETETQTDIK